MDYSIFRNIIKCHGVFQLAPNHSGLPKGYKYPTLCMALELCKVRGDI